MAEIPEGARRPSDRKKKDEPIEDRFTFKDDDGTEHMLAETAAEIRPAFLRAHRNDASMQMAFAALEILATDEQLEVIDNLSWKRYRKVQNEFDTYIGRFFEVNLGE